MSDRTITITTHQAGQSRPYADSIFESTLTFSWTPPEAVVKQVAAATMRFGSKIADKGKQENWAQGYFEFVRSEGNGVWRVRIVEPSTE